MNRTREIVEQFRVARAIARSAEITQTSHHARAEMIVPYAIHDYASRQRIGSARDLIGEIQPAAAGVQTRRLGISEHRQKMTRNRFA